jgi:hypothetical protein
MYLWCIRDFVQTSGRMIYTSNRRVVDQALLVIHRNSSYHYRKNEGQSIKLQF